MLTWGRKRSLGRVTILQWEEGLRSYNSHNRRGERRQGDRGTKERKGGEYRTWSNPIGGGRRLRTGGEFVETGNHRDWRALVRERVRHGSTSDLQTMGGQILGRGRANCPGYDG